MLKNSDKRFIVILYMSVSMEAAMHTVWIKYVGRVRCVNWYNIEQNSGTLTNQSFQSFGKKNLIIYISLNI